MLHVMCIHYVYCMYVILCCISRMLQGISGVVLVAPSLSTDLAVVDAINRVYIYKHIKLCICTSMLVALAA